MLWWSLAAWAAPPSQAPGVFAGLAVEMNQVEGKTLIKRVIEGGPGADAGLAVGDEFLVVAGVPVEGLRLDVVVGLIRGPEGSHLPLTVKKEDGPHHYLVPRRRVIGGEHAARAKTNEARGDIGLNLQIGPCPIVGELAPGSMARAAGLQRGDVVKKVGTTDACAAGAGGLLGSFSGPVGTFVTLEVMRGESRSVWVIPRVARPDGVPAEVKADAAAREARVDGKAAHDQLAAVDQALMARRNGLGWATAEKLMDRKVVDPRLGPHHVGDFVMYGDYPSVIFRVTDAGVHIMALEGLRFFDPVPELTAELAPPLATDKRAVCPTCKGKKTWGTCGACQGAGLNAVATTFASESVVDLDPDATRTFWTVVVEERELQGAGTTNCPSCAGIGSVALSPTCATCNGLGWRYLP